MLIRHSAYELSDECLVKQVTFRRDATQGLAYYVGWLHRGAEKLGRNPRDFCPLFIIRAAAC
jgi:hypothetical protein